MKPLENYIDGNTHYIIFTKETPEKSIYQYAYKKALKLGLKVGNLIYRDGQLQITLNQF